LSEIKLPRSAAVGLLTDRYARKARLYPALFLMAPVALCGALASSIELPLAKSIAATLVACGGAFFLAQAARDAGKTKERKLFQKWGGLPSVAILRLRDRRIDAITKSRYHAKLAVLVKGTRSISAESELAAPEQADETYAAWSTYLRTRTRDTGEYPLIFEELINYGYRRNLWGLRPIGIVLSFVCFVVTAFTALLEYRNTQHVAPRISVAFCLALAFSLTWIFRISEEWVRLTADAYAERLVEATDSLTPSVTAKTKRTPAGD
jgi:hypothetical protein